MRHGITYERAQLVNTGTCGAKTKIGTFLQSARIPHEHSEHAADDEVHAENSDVACRKGLRRVEQSSLRRGRQTHDRDPEKNEGMDQRDNDALSVIQNAVRLHGPRV